MKQLVQPSIHDQNRASVFRRSRVLVLWLGLFVFCSVSAPAAPFIYALDEAVKEGNSGITNLVFTIALSEASSQTVMVDYSTLDVTATAGVDYSASFGVAIFTPGTLTQYVSVNIMGDTLNEADETFWLRLTNAVNGTLLNNHAVGTILNDDPASSLSIGDLSVVEGNSGTTNAVFSVDLSPASGQTVTVDYLTVDGTAVAGADYVPIADTITFVAGATHTTITVPVYGDLLNEAAETFFVQLTNPVSAVISKGAGTGTIVDDDPLPSLTIADTTLLEGNTGSTNAGFLLSLSPPSGRSLSVNYATAPLTAVAGTDFIATNGTITFPAGTTSLPINVAVAGDTQIEPNETFLVNLSNAVNVTLARTQAVGTILDDETRTLAFTNAVAIAIPDFGAGSVYPAPIEISGVTGVVIAVTATLSGLTHSSPNDLDVLLVGPLGQRVLLMSDAGSITPVAGINLTFSDAASGGLPGASGLTSGTFKPTNFGAGDSFSPPAPGGPFDSAMSAFSGLNPNGTWALYVYDDAGGNSGSLSGWVLGLTLSNLVCCAGGANADLSVTVSDSPDSIAATSNLTYTVRVINNGPAAATGVRLTNTLAATAAYVAASATQGSLSQSGGTVVWNVGSLGVGVMATASIIAAPGVLGTITNRATVAGNEPDPNAVNNIATTPTLVTTAPLTIAISDVALVEGNNGTTNAIFNVTLSRTNNQVVSVDYYSTDGSAQAGSDYVAVAGTISWAAGQTNQTIAVPVYGDTLVEPNETFVVTLQNPANAVIGRAIGTATILNDDGLPGLVDHFAWSAVASPQVAGQPFSVSITAKDISNNTVTGFNQPVWLQALTGTGPELSVVIAEIDTGDIDRVEFANVSGAPVDVSGWQVTTYDWVSWPNPAFVFTIPAGTVVGANQLFILSDNGVAPGAYPSFFSGVNSYWDNSETNNAVAVLLQDAVGRIADFACGFDPDISQIALPLPIPSSQWSGPPIVANTNASATFQRTGNVDSNSSNNWVIANSTIGSPNPGMGAVFSGTHTLPLTPSVVSNFAGGVWTGSLAVLQVGNGVTLRASDFQGHIGTGNAFNVTMGTNHAPVLSPVANQSVAAGSLLQLTLQASDVDAGDSLTFAFAQTAPPGASLSPSGLFSWTPTFGQAPSTNLLAVRVLDNGFPSLSATQTFLVWVLPAVVDAPFIDRIERVLPRYEIRFQAEPGYGYQVQFAVTPNAWQVLTNISVPPVFLDTAVSDSALGPQRFYRARNVTVPDEPPWIGQGEREGTIFTLHLVGEPGRTYAVEWNNALIAGAWPTLTTVSVPAMWSDQVIVDPANTAGRSYRVIRSDGAEVPLQSTGLKGDGCLIYFKAKAGQSYTLEYRDSLSAGSWQTLSVISASSADSDLIVPDYGISGKTQRFYRIKK